MSLPQTQPQIVCVNLSDDAMRTLSLAVGGEFHLHRMQLHQHSAICAEATRAEALLIGWQETGRHCQDLLGQISLRGRSFLGKIFIVVPSGYTGRRFSTAANVEYGIKRWIQLPGDAIVIQKFLGEGTDIPSPTHSHSRKDNASIQDREIAKLLGILGRKWAREAERQKNLSSTLAIPFQKRLMVLHGGSFAQAADFGQIVFDAGFQDVRVYDRPAQLVSESRLHGGDAVLLWYDKDHIATVKTIEHLLEGREFEIPKTLVVYPGKGALNALVQKNPHLVFDALMEFSRNREQIRDTILNLFKPDADRKESATTLLRTLRHEEMDLKRATLLARKLAAKPGKDYWARAEIIPHQIREGNPQAAFHLARELAKKYPKSFDALYLKYLEKRAIDPKSFKPEEFVDEVVGIGVLSIIRITQVAARLHQWRKPDALKDLLVYWEKEPSLPKDHHYLNAMASYYRMIGVKSQELDYTLLAIEKNPLASGYLEAGARCLASSGKLEHANSLLSFALQAPMRNHKRLTMTLARNLVKAGRSDRAAQLLEALIRAYPNYEPGRKLYRRLFPSILDVS